MASIGNSILTMQDLNSAICGALGVATEDVVSVTLRMQAGELPLLTIERLVRESASTVLTEFERFELHPKHDVVSVVPIKEW